MNEKGRTLSCKELMEKLGMCIDKAKALHFPDKETELCARVSNAVYLLLLTITEIKKSRTANWENDADAAFCDCVNLLDYAMEQFLQAGSEEMSAAIDEGMRAIHSFKMAKALLNQLLKSVQAESESSHSSDDESHS